MYTTQIRRSAEIDRLEERYPEMYLFDRPQYYATWYIAKYDPADKTWDTVYKDICPYFYGFDDETNEQYTLRRRKYLEQTFFKQHINLSDYQSANDLAMEYLKDLVMDEGNSEYEKSFQHILDVTQWYFEERILAKTDKRKW